MEPSKIPVAEFHTADELLAAAREALALGNPKLYRGAVLDALAALEWFVTETVFPALKNSFSSEFAEWLQEKTKMDFDSRLSVLAPIATGATVDKDTRLWNDFKETRKIRTGVVHGGRKVSRADVERVIASSADWIAYLGRTIELKKALLELKCWVERGNTEITEEFNCQNLVREYFMRSNAASVTTEKVFQLGSRRIHADAVLEFGSEKVLIETKVHRNRSHLDLLKPALSQLADYRQKTGIRLAAVIVFSSLPSDQLPIGVQSHFDGQVYSVFISTSRIRPD